ncbi:MAG: hypothetical protein KJ749_09970 [Planctomycetes bacterium]|nr:hypothetical protein [Planctomycetota bacterium]
MKTATVLDLIDIGSMALPEFQRGYRFFTSVENFKEYVTREVLAEAVA